MEHEPIHQFEVGNFQNPYALHGKKTSYPAAEIDKCFIEASVPK